MPLEPPVITIDLGCCMLVSAPSQGRAGPPGSAARTVLLLPQACCGTGRPVYMGAAAQGQGGNPRRGMDAKVTGRSKAVHSMTGFARRDGGDAAVSWRSEEHTSELQSLMRISYAVFCLKKKKIQQHEKQSK